MRKPSSFLLDSIIRRSLSTCLTLFRDSVVKIDISRSYNDIIVQPVVKKTSKEEIVVEEDSKYFDKYINQAQSSASSTTNLSSTS